jgi:hypothetical protein
MRALVLPTATLVILAGATSAYSQISATFGRITEAATPSGGLTADYKRASRFTLPTAGSITRLCAYLDGKGGAGSASDYQPVNLALYTDDNGKPGSKVFEANGSFVQGGSAASWYCMAGPLGFPLHPVAAGTYWIALQSGSPGGIARDFGDGPANFYSNADSYSDGASASFGAGNAGSVTLSVYAEYFPDSQVRNVGRTTVGPTPSGGMTADFKRASSFTLPERGKLYALTAYIDGGGASGADGEPQEFRYVIYTDVNGSPGAKVYEGGNLITRKGWPGMWIYENADPPFAPTLDAGRYWFTIFTGSTGGIARNFADSTPGNWYGNADLFSDLASPQFGPGNRGTGTISAFLSYRPGTITSGVVGRTDIGTHPSKGLSANFIRWSQFQTNDVSTTLTGLRAYLDGLGATSGSQQVRMVIYGLHADAHTEYWYKIAQSADVTIPAGMQPQWVSFPVPSVPLDGTHGFYLIGIQSGDSGGVARDYGDDRLDPAGNWFGASDAFADGAAQTPDANAPRGEGTLSVYATYSLPPP